MALIQIELCAELKAAVQDVRKAISARKNARWTFNTEELREYSYEELYSRRDQERVEGQMFPATLDVEKMETYHQLKREDEEAERRRRAGQEVGNEAAGMSDQELLEVINYGGVALTEKDLDLMKHSIIYDEDEAEPTQSKRPEKPQKKPSKPKYGK